MSEWCGNVTLKRSGCVEDFISILLANQYTVSLAYSGDDKLKINIHKEKNNETD